MVGKTKFSCKFLSTKNYHNVIGDIVCEKKMTQNTHKWNNLISEDAKIYGIDTGIVSSYTKWLKLYTLHIILYIYNNSLLLYQYIFEFEN